MTTNIDTNNLDIHTTPYDIRRDLFLFMQYVQENEIKRTVYGNLLSKSEYKRIAKKLGRLELMEDYDKDMGVFWIDYIDELALHLKWIDYDTEGTYSGYTSSEPSFRENYIKFRKNQFDPFLKLSALEQEKYLYRHFKERYSTDNDLMNSGLYNLLDNFSSWGSATGVLPTLDFAKSKSILLDVLATLTPNTWYATTDLIERMKKEHPWFLIPKEVYVEENAGWKKPKKKVLYPRYYNFIEGERYGRSGTMKDRCIKENDPKAFEKVEGRFIERFLTRYLYTLGYVHIGMDKNPYTGEKPEMGTLIAFQLQSTFFHVLNNQLLSTKVSVQPNFEIYIDAPTYPIAILNALAPLTKMLKEDQQIILKLEKKYVLNHLIEHPTFDTAQFLSNLSDTPIPQNVLMEMQEWTERTDVFTLYEGFGLYEGYTKQALADSHTEATIPPTIRLIRKPTNLYEKLQKSEVIPMLIEHTDKNFTPLPTLAKSIFPSLKVEKTKKSAKQKITIERKEWLVYTISNKSFYEAFLSVLLKARIPVTFDKEKRSISFFKSDEANLKTILKDFKTDYQVSIKK